MDEPQKQYWMKIYNEIICIKIQNQAKLNRPLGRDTNTVGKTKKNKWKLPPTSG